MQSRIAFLLLFSSPFCQLSSALLSTPKQQTMAASIRKLMATRRRRITTTSQLSTCCFRDGHTCPQRSYIHRCSPQRHHKISVSTSKVSVPPIPRLSRYSTTRTALLLSADSSDGSHRHLSTNSNSSSSITEEGSTTHVSSSTFPDNTASSNESYRKNDVAVISAIEQAFQEHVFQPLSFKESSSQSPSPQTLNVVISVSGGCDSMALLHGMVQFCRGQERQRKDCSNTQQQEQLLPQLKLIVAHFNHNQRGVESDLDCELVVQTCQKYQIPCHVYNWNDHVTRKDEQERTKDTSTESSSSSSTADGNNVCKPQAKFSQDVARQWRRETLSSLVKDYNASDNRLNSNSNASCTSEEDQQLQQPRRGIILTAHHKGDSYESLLLKVLRGAHITNLHQGIAPSSTIGHGSIQLLRPFLSLSKQDLIDYLQDNKEEFGIQMNHQGLSPSSISEPTLWREDESNSSPKYLRNRVRNELIPLLEDLLSSRQYDENKHMDNTSNECNAGDNNKDQGRVLLERRLDNFMDQSYQIQNDLQSRVAAYIRRTVLDNGKYFQVTSNDEDLSFIEGINSSSSSLVRSQALYQWISSRMEQDHDDDGDSGNGIDAVSDDDFTSSTERTLNSNLSYEQLRRVVNQLDDYPNNRQWTLQIGSHWNVIRIGDVLSVVVASNHKSPSTSEDGSLGGFGGDLNHNNGPITSSGFYRSPKLLSYERLPKLSPDHRQEQDDKSRSSITICIPGDNNHDLDMTFLISTVGSWESNVKSATTESPPPSPPSLTFVPKWRKGRTPIKLKHFLRGQHIPQHERETTPIIMLRLATKDSHDGIAHHAVVAVYIKNEWMIHADYDSTSYQLSTNSSSTSNDNTQRKHYDDDLTTTTHVRLELPETATTM